MRVMQEETMNRNMANVPVPPSRCNETSSSSSSSETDTDLYTKLVFLRLQPVVDNLLRTIRRYTTLVSQQERNELPEQTANLLQEEYRHVKEIHDILQNVGSDYDLSENQISNCLNEIADYILLPLVLILRWTSLKWSSIDDDDDDDDDDMKTNLDVVIRSNSFKCVERASSTIVMLLDLIRLHSGVSRKRKRKLLGFCASALPTGIEIVEGFTVDNTALVEHCLHRLLTLLEAVLQQRSDGQESFTKEAPLLKIVDCLAALVRPIPRKGRGGGGDDDLNRDSERQIVSKEIRVQALKVLEMLLCQVNDPPVWRRFFPELFKGLCLSAVQSLRVSQLSSRITVHSVKVLSRLLRTTWYKENHDHPSFGESKSAESTIMDKLQSLAKNSGKGVSRDDGTDPSNEESTLDSEFFRQADKVLPGGLTVLIRILSAASTSTIRLQALCINSVVLGKTDLTADTKASDELVITAFESCLVLSQDEDDEVKSAATHVLEECLSSANMRQDVTVFVGPRILCLVEELLPLSESQRNTEIQTSLKLISAYLQLGSFQTDTRKRLRLFLAEENAIRAIKDVFAKLLDTKFELAMKGELDCEIVPQGNILEFPGPSLKYLGTETLRCVQTTIECLAKVLGTKQTAVLIDSCIADLHEACLSRVEQGLPLTGLSQFNWVHSWIGMIKFSLYLLSGGFSPKCYPNAKLNHRKYMKSLASSAVPLVTSYPLWKLPVTGSNDHPIAPLVVQTNEEMTICLLELLESILEALGDDAVDTLPMILYPVVEKAASDVSRISDRAWSVLEYISQCSSCQDLTSLFRSNVGPLTSYMMNRLRIPGGQCVTTITTTSSSDVLEEIMQVVQVASLVFGVVGEKRESPGVMKAYKDEDFIFSCMDELAMKLIQLFDHLSTEFISDESIAGAFLRLFNSIADILTSKNIQVGATSKVAEEDMHGVLESFKKNRAAKGFTEHHERKSKKILSSEGEDGTDMSLLRRGTSLAGSVLARCGYLLSHESLFVQVRSCEVLNRLFHYLGQVALAIPSDDEKEANGPRTAVLRRIHDLWPSISSKLKTLSDEVTVLDQVSLSLVKSQNLLVDGSSNTGQKRVYLSKMLELSAAMAECSDDFMSFRFRGDIWPCARKVLSSFLWRGAMDRGAKLSSSEKNLLLALIACLGSFFAHRPTGVALADLIPSVGALLLPLLRIESDEIVTPCIKAMRHLLQIDCDSLWRQLVFLSGQDLPVCPLLLSSQALETMATQEACMGSSMVAKQLLSFAEELPEKPF